jgi:hypothetical protein
MRASKRDLAHRLALTRLIAQRDREARTRDLREGNHRLRQPLQAARLFTYLMRQRTGEAAGEFGTKLDQALDGLEESWSDLYGRMAFPAAAVEIDPVPLATLWQVLAEDGQPPAPTVSDDVLVATDPWLLYQTLRDTRIDEVVVGDEVVISLFTRAASPTALKDLPGHRLERSGDRVEIGLPQA